MLVEKLVKLATENAHVNPMDLPVTSDLDPKLPANQRGLAIRLFKRSPKLVIRFRQKA